MSFYTNQTGPFILNQTVNITAGGVSEGLHNYYEFDESSGTNVEDVFLGNDLTTVNSPTFVPGKIGNGLDYNGVNQSADSGSNIGLTGDVDMSISVWFDLNNSKENGIVGFGSGGAGGFFDFGYIISNNSYGVSVGGTDCFKNGGFVMGTGFQFAVITHNAVNDNVSLWINNVFLDSCTVTLNTGASTLRTGITSLIGVNSQGIIDELGIWNKTLNATDINTLWNGGAAARPITVATFSNQTFEGIVNETMLWTCEACDSDGICGFATENRTVTPDITAPIINITAPLNLTDFNFVGGSETLNVTITESNLDVCLYDYNGTNVTISGCTTAVLNSEIFTLIADDLELIVYANDTSGNFASATRQWNYNVFRNSETFNANTSEGSTEIFIINYTANETPVTIQLDYNGTITSADIDATNFPVVIGTESLVLPSVSATETVPFFWNIVTLSSNVNTTSNNQTINNLALDNCSAFTNTLFNFTVIDEASQTTLDGASDNVSVEVDISIFTADGATLVLNFSTAFNETNPVAICSATTLFNGTSYLLDATIKYSAAERAIEYHNIRGATIDNASTVQNITLFDIKN